VAAKTPGLFVSLGSLGGRKKCIKSALAGQ
jgi:hypothetical protein